METVAKLIRIIMVALLMTGLKPQTWAEDLTLIAPVYNLEPVGYIEDGNLQGIFVDYLMALAKEADIEMHFSMVPYNRMIFLLEGNEADIAVFLRDRTSEVVAHPIAKVATLRSVVVAKRSHKIADIEDLRHLKIVALRGGYFAALLEEHGIKDYIAANDYFHAAGLLKRGRIDAMLGVEIVIQAALAKAGLQAQELEAPFLFGEVELWIHISHRLRGSSVEKRLVKAAAILAGNHLYDRLADTYTATIRQLTDISRTPSSGTLPDQ